MWSPRAYLAAASSAGGCPVAYRLRPDLLRERQLGEPKVGGLDVLSCPRCGGRRRVVAVVTEAHAVQRILATLTLGMRDVAQLSQLLAQSGRRVLTPLQNASELSSVPQDIVRRLDFTFYTDPVDATLKALGV